MWIKPKWLMFAFMVVSMSLEIWLLSNQQLQDESAVFEPLRDDSIYIQPTSCSDIRASAKFDPNNGTMYHRLTITDPAFHISLHNKKYDRVRWSTFEKGIYYEGSVTQHAKEILIHQPPSLVIDVGMNIGWFSLYAAAMGHEIAAFEPNPANLLRFCESVKLNGWDHRPIQLFSNCVGNYSGSVELKWIYNPGSAAVFHKKEYNWKLLAKTENVGIIPTTMVTLDHVAAIYGWMNRPSIPLLKIDVEGYDYEVLVGAKNLLRSRLIQNIFIEMSPDVRDKESTQAKFRLLFEAGYTMHVFGNWAGRQVRNAPTFTGDIDAYSAACYDHAQKLTSATFNLWWKLAK